MKLCVLDEREIWHGPLIEAAKRRGYDARRIRRGEEANGPGVGFIRPHADPQVLPRNHQDFRQMAERLTMIQDAAQVEVYDDKSEQFRRWGQFMPRTWRIAEKELALELVTHPERYDTPDRLVSKADVGASSINVWILKTRAEQMAHIAQVFGKGIEVNHCAGGPGGRNVKSLHRGHVLLQEFIPHEVTWRVNIVGRCWAIFKRFCYANREVAQTGNVEPVMRLDAEMESLLDFSGEVVKALDTRWCALDILKSPTGWRLIETSLAWPWPSPGGCMEAPFFGATNHVWAGIWELMLDEFEGGAWSV